MLKRIYRNINTKIIAYIMLLVSLIILVGCSNTGNQSISSESSNIEKEDTIDKVINTNGDIEKNEANENNSITEDSEENNINKENSEDTEENEKIQIMIENMTIEEKVGQLFLVHCNADDYGMMQYNVGGIILFNDSIKNKNNDTMKEYINSYQIMSKIPMLVGVDEEGGSVSRVGSNKSLSDTKFKSPQELYAEGGLELVAEDVKRKSTTLKELGFNLNLAPVADVSINKDDYIYKRTLGLDAAHTSAYITTVVIEMDKINIGSTLKHFPGYGNNKDTHENIVVDNREYDNFEKNDLQPFKAGVLAGADSILVSHNIVSCIDEDNPASISYKVINIIRDNLKFDGIVMTDDMGMKGIVNYMPEDEAAVQAILAGNDMIISTNYNVQIEAITNAVYDGRITEDRLNESVRRILMWKDKLGLLH